MVLTTKIKELQHYARFDEIFVLSLLILFTNVIVKVVLALMKKHAEKPARVNSTVKRGLYVKNKVMGISFLVAIVLSVLFVVPLCIWER